MAKAKAAYAELKQCVTATDADDHEAAQKHLR